MDLIKSKIISLEEMAQKCDNLRQFDHVVVLTSGAYDLIHDGHVRFLCRARTEGDKLFVILDSDGLIRSKKSDGRPIRLETSRAITLAAWQMVDQVAIFSDYEQAIRLIRPNILVASQSSGNGSPSYQEKISARGRLCQRLDIRYIRLPEQGPLHSSDIIHQIKAL